jgi:hypothetical protein
VGVDSGQFYHEELKRDQFDLFQIEFSFAILLILSIAVKDWAKPSLNHVDPHHHQTDLSSIPHDKTDQNQFPRMA